MSNGYNIGPSRRTCRSCEPGDRPDGEALSAAWIHPQILGGAATHQLHGQPTARPRSAGHPESVMPRNTSTGGVHIGRGRQPRTHGIVPNVDDEDLGFRRATLTVGSHTRWHMGPVDATTNGSGKDAVSSKRIQRCSVAPGTRVVQGVHTGPASASKDATTTLSDHSTIRRFAQWRWIATNSRPKEWRFVARQIGCFQ